MSGEPDSYTFGDTGDAAERLRVIARVFDPTMAAVLAELPDRRRRRVVDLGCGPASSTERLAGRVMADQLVGVDASPAFCDEARRRLPTATFTTGDVRDPVPGPPADLVYARFVLSHLPDPLGVAEAWRSRLAPDGALVLEEPERIETDDDVFRRYLALTESLVASRGASMYVGPALAALPAAINRVQPLEVSAVDAATMFALNLATIRHDPWVTATHPVDALDDLAAGLHVRRVSRMRRAPVGWHVRQVVTSA